MSWKLFHIGLLSTNWSGRHGFEVISNEKMTNKNVD